MSDSRSSWEERKGQEAEAKIGEMLVEKEKSDTPFLDIATEIGQLVEIKNAAYGSAFEKSGEVLKQIFPNGVQPSQYTDMLLAVRIIDKMFRVGTDKDALGESPWRDVAGYGVLGAYNDAKRGKK